MSCVKLSLLVFLLVLLSRLCLYISLYLYIYICTCVVCKYWTVCIVIKNTISCCQSSLRQVDQMDIWGKCFDNFWSAGRDGLLLVAWIWCAQAACLGLTFVIWWEKEEDRWWWWWLGWWPKSWQDLDLPVWVGAPGTSLTWPGMCPGHSPPGSRGKAEPIGEHWWRRYGRWEDCNHWIGLRNWRPSGSKIIHIKQIVRIFGFPDVLWQGEYVDFIYIWPIYIYIYILHSKPFELNLKLK